MLSVVCSTGSRRVLFHDATNNRLLSSGDERRLHSQPTIELRGLGGGFIHKPSPPPHHRHNGLEVPPSSINLSYKHGLYLSVDRASFSSHPPPAFPSTTKSLNYANHSTKHQTRQMNFRIHEVSNNCPMGHTFFYSNLKKKRGGIL